MRLSLAINVRKTVLQIMLDMLLYSHMVPRFEKSMLVVGHY